jgi:hypothetical protein
MAKRRGGPITGLRNKISSLKTRLSTTTDERARAKIELDIFDIERKIKILQMNNKSGLSRLNSSYYEIRVASTS